MKRLLSLLFILMFVTTAAFAAVTIKLRRDTAANWTTNDPTLAAGEIGFETDTRKQKVGDGATAWTALAYATSSVDLTAPGPIGGTTPSTAAFTTVSADDIIIAPPPAGETGEIGLKEAPANGTNEVILKAPAALAANVTITLPAGVVPASATATCMAGQWWYDASYWYVCTATNTWRRAALATW